MKKVFISGAGGGIGKALVKKYLAEGYYVIGQYNTHSGLEKEFYSGCEFIQADFSRCEDVEKLCCYLIEHHSDLEIIINNAGIDYYGLFSEMKTEDIQKVLAVNLFAPMQLTARLGNTLLHKQCGQVLNISSIWGSFGGSMEVAYSASKGGIESFTKALAKEWGLMGIRVNALRLGFIDTPMNQRFSQEDKNAFCEAVALGKIGTPEQVAETAFFITSDKASYITGQIIGVDGGY